MAVFVRFRASHATTHRTLPALDQDWTQRPTLQ